MPTSSRTSKLQDLWDGRVQRWSDTVEASPTFTLLRTRMLDIAQPRPTDRCLDLGAGSGFITLPLATQTASVKAVDLSGAMLEALRGRAEQAGLSNVSTEAIDMAGARFPSSSFDLVISGYAMHYLLDADKMLLLSRIHDWLVPGGRLVISDMMLGRSLDQHHRRVLADKAASMLRRGPAGWWRLLKNFYRLAAKRGRLHPCAPAWWIEALPKAGFVDVRYEHVASEAGVISGTTPAS